MDTLLFIDTNILLDFYRSRNEASLKLLKHLDGVHDKLITTYQVQMEFKKNRQHVILESYNALKSPDIISAPAFLSEAKATKGLQKNMSGAKKHVDAMKKRITRLFVKPTVHDPVYKVVQRMFTDKTPFNLTRDNKIRFSIRRLAFKRFILGYPPRKKNDTSIGDAINWEWLIKCAQQGNFDVVIVSRDSDYGVTFGKEAYINDWLRQEFRARISKKRQLTLTSRLAEALEKVKVSVSAEEEKVEEELVEASEEKKSYHSDVWAEWMDKLEEFKQLEKRSTRASESRDR